MQQHTQPAGAHGSSSRLSSFWNFHLNNNASISRAGDSGEMRNDPRCERYIVWWFDSRGNNCPYCVMCVAVWWRMAIRQTSDIINNGPSKDLAPKATQSTCPARHILVKEKRKEGNDRKMRPSAAISVHRREDKRARDRERERCKFA
jgi:hypothetical protein